MKVVLTLAAMKLTGFDFDVADAAARSGFDTWDQVALMDLIWSVKRVAHQYCIERTRPPMHPIYPDRYRPSGAHDNTNSRRKRRYQSSEDTIVVSQAKPDSAKEINSIRARPHASIRTSTHTQIKLESVTVQTRDMYRDSVPLIELSDDSDVDDQPTNKRPKLDNQLQMAPMSKASMANQPPKARVVSSNSTVLLKEQDRRQLCNILDSVQANLDGILTRAEDCFATMRDAYNEHREYLSQDSVKKVMCELSESFSVIVKNARQGIDQVGFVGRQCEEQSMKEEEILRIYD